MQNWSLSPQMIRFFGAFCRRFPDPYFPPKCSRLFTYRVKQGCIFLPNRPFPSWKPFPLMDFILIDQLWHLFFLPLSLFFLPFPHFSAHLCYILKTFPKSRGGTYTTKVETKTRGRKGLNELWKNITHEMYKKHWWYECHHSSYSSKCRMTGGGDTMGGEMKEWHMV